MWGLAQTLEARVLLRIEDHDRQRCQPRYEQALLEDLDWLGFEADVFPAAQYREGPCAGRQSDRDAAYRAAAAKLAERGLLFGCDCSRRDVAAAAGSELARSPAGELRYAGHCRDRGLALSDGVGWRLRMPPGAESFTDALLGCQTQVPWEQCGDPLIRDRRGNWSYQFAVAVDDLEQDIALVIRGLDLLPSTGRQIRLARWLGRPEPAVFAHHGLLMKSAAQKLSKADGDTGLHALRAAGWSAPQLLGEAARRLGLWTSRDPLAADELARLFG